MKERGNVATNVAAFTNERIMSMEPLTDAERQFLVLAIQGLCMRGGPGLFATAALVAEKLGLLDELQSSLQDWIRYAK
jgi:hypothetical protein